MQSRKNSIKNALSAIERSCANPLLSTVKLEVNEPERRRFQGRRAMLGCGVANLANKAMM
jgi:hypothetical protein